MVELEPSPFGQEPRVALAVWRQKGMNNPYAVRYPVGFNYRHQCKFAIVENDDGTLNPKPLNYIESRKEIYFKQYVRLVKKEPKFNELKKKLNEGINLNIIDVDGVSRSALQI